MITIGKVTKPHNRKGEVKCLILSDFPERFLELDRVFLENEEDIKRMHVENVRFHKDYAIVKFAEVNSMNEAEKLRGHFIKIPAHEAVELPEGHFFIHDLIGIDVYTDTGEYLGQLEDINTTGSNDIYIVRKGKKEILLPAIHDVVKEIDLESKKMIVHIIEGLID
ncbi:ribosome maturation factor RimM [Anoxybacter fermentans]|nr:ribosome maturation factor RimM [Anoxybacter fermentans]